MFVIPEDVTALSADEIAEAIKGAKNEAQEINAISDEDFTDDNLTRLTNLINFIDSAESHVERADKIAAARARVTEVTAETESKDAGEDEADAEDEPADEGGEGVVEEVEEKELVTASAAKKKPKVLGRLGGKKNVGSSGTGASVPSITAAADVPGFATGSTLASLDDVAEGFIQRYRAMPKGKIGNVQNRYGVANIQLNRTDGLVASNYRSVQDLVQAASVESRLPGGSLTAAGGWCAPSETLYDLCTIESTDGLWDLPSVQAPRGGIEFTKGPNFEDFYAYVESAFQTEAQAEAGMTKDCIEVECPDFEEVRLDAAYACIKAGILTQAAYPELVRRYVEGTLIAQQHAVSAKLIGYAQAITGAPISISDVWANALSLLHALELVAEGERQRFRMSRTATMEALLPYWVRPALRADLANRNGVELTNVTDQMIDAHFTNRQIRVQWLYNYQPLDVETDGIATRYPSTLETIMYPAGTFVKLGLDVITLDAVYDSTGLETNTYTAMFAEEGVALANVCHEPRRLSIPFSVTGLTAAPIINQNWGEEPPIYVEPSDDPDNGDGGGNGGNGGGTNPDD